MRDEHGLHSEIRNIMLSKIRVSPVAQRELRPSRVAELVKNFEPEMLGYPVINVRSGTPYVIDGNHRIEAVKIWLGDGWEKQNISCRVYNGLSEKEEADMFDRLNNVLTVRAFDKFKVRVTAGRPDETRVKKTVERVGLKIAQDGSENSIGAVTSLVRIYKRGGEDVLQRSLNIVNEAFGDAGLKESRLIDGMARLCERYNGALNDKDTIERLRAMRGHLGALMQKAETLRKQVGASLPQCVAAATVDVINAKRHASKKIPSWWQE